ncbi:MAG: NUDIX hydrolase [Candidatus Aureabacteria bacterium]|nr:NUDIX hydrolase [Candidatus Auribacterota bacterium]
MKRIVFKGKFLNVTQIKKKLPNGNVMDLEVVEHPGAVLIIPMVSKNKMILLRQFRPVIDSYLYELPAGILEKGETVRKCAKRELLEETGYFAKKITRLGKIYTVPGYSTEEIVIMKAENLIKKTKDLHQHEIIRTLLLDKKEIKKLFKTKRIVDAKTICALAMCGWI